MLEYRQQIERIRASMQPTRDSVLNIIENPKERREFIILLMKLLMQADLTYSLATDLNAGFRKYGWESLEITDDLKKAIKLLHKVISTLDNIGALGNNFATMTDELGMLYPNAVNKIVMEVYKKHINII